MKRDNRLFMALLLAGTISAAGPGVQAQTQEAELIKVYFSDPAYFTSLSDNGLWATAKGASESDQAKDGYPYLVNATDGSVTKLWTEEQTMDFIGANDVTNDGKLVVGSYNESAAIYNTDSKEWTMLPSAEGLNAKAFNVTPDGKYIAGWGSEGSFSEGTSYREVPMMWEKQQDGSYKEIDVYKEFANFPTETKAGEKTQMVRITTMSADGNLVGGAMNFIYPGENCFYIYNRAEQKYFFVDSYMTVENGSYIDNSMLSNDGKWVSGTAYAIVPMGGAFCEEYNAAYRYNINDGKFDLYNEETDEKDRMGACISNSGVTFASSPALNPVRTAYYRFGTIWYGLDELLSGRYSIDFFGETEYNYTGSIIGISDDEKVVLGMSETKQKGYIIRLPETFQEAASHINPMKSVTVYPESGSSFARLSAASVTFNKKTTLQNGAMAQLIDSEGKTVAEYGIVDTGNGKNYTVVGQDAYKLETGKKYTLKIAAGAFTLFGDDTYKSKEITAEYIGREEAPVKMVAAAPADNSNVSEISSNSPVQIQFDSKLMVTKEASAALYEAGSDTPLTTLEVSVSDTYVMMYPSVKRYLRKGATYEVVLKAGSVTDIMGFCKNEDTKVTYNGTYEQPFTPEGDLFKDDFNNPAVSMMSYLLYEGDHNNPTSDMVGLEFNKESTPWNFTIRESSTSTDYCAASTSMYNPAGKSDDWMSLPQLTIASEDYALSFDAQSYLNSKNDVLRVYILADEAVYETFTEELREKFMTEGKCVYEKQLTPGSSEENLTGDWQSETISLEEYSGRSIYIAFANENDDQSLIFLDNIRVYYNGEIYFNNNTEKTVIAAENVEVKGSIRISGDKTYNNLTAFCTSEDGAYSDTFTANDLNLSQSSGVYEFSFPNPMPVAAGKETKYTINVTLDDKNIRNDGAVKNLAFEPKKRVVLEEATGQWCGNCPLGIVAIENLHKVYGDKVIAIGVHNNTSGADQFAFNEYVNYLGFMAFPSGRINRIDTIYAPSANGSFISEEGNQTFQDIVSRELNDYTYADVNIKNAYFDKVNNNVEVEMNVNYAIDMTSLNHNIAFVVIENGLVGKQTNYFYNNEGEIVGEFGKGGKYGNNMPEITFNDVARAILDRSFAGTAGVIPGEVKAGEAVEYTQKATLPETVENWNNAEIVCMLLDANTGRVINAAKAKFTDKNGVADEAADSIKVYGAEGAIYVIADEDAEVTVYDASGMPVCNEAAKAGEVKAVACGKSGLYIVKTTAGDNTSIQKVMVK